MHEYTRVFGTCALRRSTSPPKGDECMSAWVPHSAGAAVIAETRDYLTV